MATSVRWCAVDAHVRPCGLDDIDALGANLGAAFGDDPVFSYIVPDVDEQERARRLTPLFKATIRIHRHFGEAWTNEDATVGALWLPPGRKVPQWRQLGAGAASVRASWRTIPKGLRVLAIMEKAHPKEPHWYLAVLGAAPQHQRKGLGGAAMAPILDRCDREGIPAYLESSKESNIAYYERVGFKVTGELSLGPGGAPNLWPMWREPA
jgi:GNAT superfamily N-acetyltransferase